MDAVRGFACAGLGITNTPGVTVALARRGRVIWEAGIGYADLAARRAMRADSVTRAGSVSKIYTSIAVLQLVEHGCLALLEPLSRYLPELGLENPLGPRPITVHDLLTFRSGLSADATVPSFVPPPPLEAFVRRAFADGPAEYGGAYRQWSAQVGERFQYSNLGVAVLGYLVERTNPEALTFTDYLARNVLDPLRLRLTVLPPWPRSPSVPPDVRSAMTTGYADFGMLRIKSPFVGAATYPASGLLTTAGDHCKLLMALMRGGTYQGATILEPQSVELMQVPQTPLTLTPGSPSDWMVGIGLVLGNLHSRDYHFGYPGLQFWGWASDTRVYPELDLVVVAFCNSVEMLAWHEGSRLPLPMMIAEYAASLLSGLRDGIPLPGQTDLSWLLSYASGLLTSERLAGFLGIADISEARRSRLAAVHADGPVPSDAAFRQGLGDGAAAASRPDGLHDLLTSGRCDLHPANLPLLVRALGGSGSFPTPVDFGQQRRATL